MTPLVMALVGAGCFSESNSYDDCARVECASSSDGGTAGDSATTSASSSLPTSSASTSLDGGEVESTASDPATVTSETDSGSEGARTICGDGVVDAPEQCEDPDDVDPNDGCDASCQISPQLVWSYPLDYLRDGLADAVLALTPDGDYVQAAAVVGGGDTYDDAYWFRLRVDSGFLDPGWGQYAELPENNRVLALGRSGSACAIGGYINGWSGVALAAGNVLDCSNGHVAGDLAIGGPEQDGIEGIRALVVRGDGTIVVGGVRLHDGAPRGWIAELAAGGASLQTTTWLDTAFFGTASVVNALALAPDADTVFVAGDVDDGGITHGFAAPFTLVTSMPAAFAPSDDESSALDVRPLPTGMAIAGWSRSPSGDSDARVELFDMDGGAPLVWTLGDAGEDRLHALAEIDGVLVGAGYAGSLATAQDLLLVWLDDALVEQQRALWSSPDLHDDVAWDVVATADGVMVGGATDGQLLVQRWAIPEPG